MKLSETQLLLGYIALTDNRTIDEFATRAWHDSLRKDMSLDDGRAAVVHHRLTSTEYLNIGHINAYVSALKAERKRNAPIMVIPADMHQAQERAWTLSFWDAVKNGSDDPHAAADQAFGVVRPELPSADVARLKQIINAKPTRSHSGGTRAENADQT